MYQLVAHEANERFLFKNKGMLDGKGIVVDLAVGHAYPAANIDSILSRGYWEDKDTADQEKVDQARGMLLISR